MIILSIVLLISHYQVWLSLIILLVDVTNLETITIGQSSFKRIPKFTISSIIQLIMFIIDLLNLKTFTTNKNSFNNTRTLTMDSCGLSRIIIV